MVDLGQINLEDNDQKGVIKMSVLHSFGTGHMSISISMQ